jgi:hypothetical protein
VSTPHNMGGIMGGGHENLTVETINVEIFGICVFMPLIGCRYAHFYFVFIELQISCFLVGEKQKQKPDGVQQRLTF